MSRKELISDELIQVAEQGGGVLKPASVVEFARTNPDSALHGEFEWNDGAAAEKYRLQQARTVIRAQVTVLDEGPTEIRAWVSIQQDRTTQGGGYRPVREVMSEEDKRRQLLTAALAQLAAWRRRYAQLSELAVVFAASDEVTKAG